jgi:hypothetical protein
MRKYKMLLVEGIIVVGLIKTITLTTIPRVVIAGNLGVIKIRK